MKISEELLKRYVTGDCTEEEQQFVEKWMNSQEGVDSGLSETEVSQMERRIQQRFEKNHRFVVSHPSHGKWKQLAKYAAAIAIFVAVGTLTYWFLNPLDNPSKDTLVSWEGYTIKESKRGERSTLTLLDGTTVHLNSESLLKFPERFSDTERVVYLEGHAHFDVVRNTEKPFIIYTEASKTQVLGTSFDIKTSAVSNTTEIVVTSGKVAFSDRVNAQKEVILTLNKRAVLEAKKTIRVDDVDAEIVTAWKTNQLLFEKASLADIIKVIEPWYDVQVEVVEPSLLLEKYRLQMNDPSLKEFMDYLSDLGDLLYGIEGNKVTIQ